MLKSDERDTDVESELSREVVHAAGMHQTQSVSHRLRAQDALACDWTEAAVGQSGRHDAGALTGHLDGAQLMETIKTGFILFHRLLLSSSCILKQNLDLFVSELHSPGSRSRGWRSCLCPLENTAGTKTPSTAAAASLQLTNNLHRFKGQIKS